MTCFAAASQATVQATVPQTRVVLSVAPVPTARNRAPGTPEVTWSTGDGSPGLVTVSADSGREVVFAAEPEGTAQAPWIAVGVLYTFRLYSTVSGRALLATLRVGKAAAAEIVALPPKPTITSPFENRLLQVAVIGLLPLFTILAVASIRERRRAR